MRELAVALLMLCMFVNVSFVSALDVDDIQYYTEENAPGNFTENGKLKGIAVELLELIWKDMGYPKQKIRMVPWPRGYDALKRKPGTCLFGTTYTVSRDKEEQFKWVGPIKPNNIVLFANSYHNIKLSSLDDAKQYKIGTVVDDVGEVLLLDNGFDLATLDRTSNVISNLKKLSTGRIDLFAKNSDSVISEIRAKKLNMDGYEIVWTLSEQDQYYAFHKDTPQELIDRFQAALDGLEDKRQELLKKYGVVK